MRSRRLPNRNVVTPRAGCILACMTRAILRAAAPSTVLGYVHPAGTEVTVLEPLGETHVLVEVRIPDETLEGGACFDCIEVERAALALISPA